MSEWHPQPPPPFLEEPKDTERTAYSRFPVIWSTECWGPGRCQFSVYVSVQLKGKSSLAEEVCPWTSRGCKKSWNGHSRVWYSTASRAWKEYYKEHTRLYVLPTASIPVHRIWYRGPGVRPARQLKSSQERIRAPFSKPFCLLTENRVSQTTILRIAFETPGLWKQESLPESLLIFLRLL